MDHSITPQDLIRKMDDRPTIRNMADRRAIARPGSPINGNEGQATAHLQSRRVVEHTLIDSAYGHQYGAPLRPTHPAASSFVSARFQWDSWNKKTNSRGRSR